MQVSGGFQVPADWCWLVLVGALVGDGLASDDAPWLPIVNRASSRESDVVQICRKQTRVLVQRVAAASWLDALN
jgi:hypothetical protein